jgi:hypothetical protein
MTQEQIIAVFTVAVPDATVPEMAAALRAAAEEQFYEADRLERRVQREPQRNGG